MRNFLFGKAWHAVIFVLISWALVTVSIFWYSTEITRSLLPFIIGFLFVYPIGTFITCLWYAKRYGQIYMLQIPMFIIVIFEYFLFGFDSVEPNYLVMSLIVILFGTNIGKMLCENEEPNPIAERIKAKKAAKENAEKKYKSIIDNK